MIPIEEQISAILGANAFRWAAERLPDGKTMDDVRFRDFITVSADDVYEFVLAHGFDDRAVCEGGNAVDHVCASAP